MRTKIPLRELKNGDRVNLRGGYSDVLILGPLTEYEPGSDKWNFAIQGADYVAKAIGHPGSEEVELLRRRAIAKGTG